MSDSSIYTSVEEVRLAEQDCIARLNGSSNTEDGFGDFTTQGLFCPGLFDGWTCWPSTPAGEVASEPCPAFIVGFDPHRSAYKICEENGEWYFHTVFNKTWSNYTTCVNKEDLLFRQMVITVHTVGYSISLVALLTSLMIFGYFKSLRCARITVHMNLFASFAMNNLLWLLWNNLVVYRTEVVSHNPIWCKVLHVVLYFFLLSNYSWMLCEGLYLHTVLVSAFVSETKLLRGMVLLGWGLPVKFIIIYAYQRAFHPLPDSDSICWMEEANYNIILLIPVVGTVAFNIIFLCNILRVLYVKLRKQPQAGSGASRASLQALRATLLLIPLLGLNYLVTPFRPNQPGAWEFAYEMVSGITSSLQGLCVAILFCFCNGEVIAQIKRKWRMATYRPRANSCTVTTVSVRKHLYVCVYGSAPNL
ncbi:calcitonin gene-related peptide type 1 receptor isoform X2 [Atheta coriaria]|uniref:calcitonin gene-related peptide type 1 receptor isoform X2 n=1 Tax=Dalotia coriaria TaxID=877792 RepID=UPI0031F3D330